MEIQNERLECSVFGRVHLVMFRDFVKRKADALGICGTVENRSDVSVFVVAEGGREQLEKLVLYLKKGPIFAKVSRIEPHWLTATGDYSDFKIYFYDNH